MQDFGELDKLESMTSLVELSLVSNVVSIQDFLLKVFLYVYMLPVRYFSMFNICAFNSTYTNAAIIFTFTDHSPKKLHSFDHLIFY